VDITLKDGQKQVLQHQVQLLLLQLKLLHLIMPHGNKYLQLHGILMVVHIIVQPLILLNLLNPVVQYHSVLIHIIVQPLILLNLLNPVVQYHSVLIHLLNLDIHSKVGQNQILQLPEAHQVIQLQLHRIKHSMLYGSLQHLHQYFLY